jgi:proline racemase
MRFERTITAVDVHAGGEPGRVITAGAPPVPGDTMYAKMEHLRDREDWLRRVMLREPRGYPALCCNVLLPPTDPRADAGFVVMEQAEYPPMSGSNTICVVTALIETGMVPVTEPVTELALDTPAGLVRVRAAVRNGRCESVTFRNVPAFAAYLDALVEVPEIGSVTVDVAWGGMFYVIADAARFGFALTPDEGADITRVTEMLKAAAREQLPVAHPENPAIHGITIGQLYGPARTPGARRRNAVTVSSGSFDWNRPATWTGGARPLCVRDRHVGRDGGAACQGRARDRRGLRARERDRQRVHGKVGRADGGRGPAGGGSRHHRQRLDHGLRGVRDRSGRPVRGGLHRRRPVGLKAPRPPAASARARHTGSATRHRLPINRWMDIRRTLGCHRPALAFAGIALLALASTWFQTAGTDWRLVGVCGALALAVTAVAWFVPWSRLPASAMLVLPIASDCAIALLRQAQGGSVSGYSPLAVLPVSG